MRTYFAVLIWSTLATFFLTPLAKKVAFQWGAIDLPNERKIHNGAMPRLGGLAVFWGFCFPWIAFYFLENRLAIEFRDYETIFGVLLLGGTAMLGLGIYDDVKGIAPWQKLFFQLLIAVGLYFGGFQIVRLSNPFGDLWELGWLSLPVSVLWIVGLTNAINLLDGIDGLVTGITACISLALALMNIMGNNTMVALLTLCLAGACLGFLPYNFSPARIFLGDSGSLFIGLILACTVMLSQHKATTGTFVVVPLILLGLPLYDTATVVFGRMRRGQPIFRADRSHVHHRLLNQGLSQKQTAWILYGITVVLGVLAVLIVARQVQNSPPGLDRAIPTERAVLISKQQFEFLLMGGVVLVSGVGLAIWRAWKLYTNKISPDGDHIYAGPYASPKPHLSSDPSAGR
jgi:UDP-GlcNAc:undecaprenyl-phosphate/decaprenyl-phosphate GlcNAc-1-phosphate transferase